MDADGLEGVGAVQVRRMVSPQARPGKSRRYTVAFDALAVVNQKPGAWLRTCWLTP